MVNSTVIALEGYSGRVERKTQFVRGHPRTPARAARMKKSKGIKRVEEVTCRIE